MQRVCPTCGGPVCLVVPLPPLHAEADETDYEALVEAPVLTHAERAELVGVLNYRSPELRWSPVLRSAFEKLRGGR